MDRLLRKQDSKPAKASAKGRSLRRLVPSVVLCNSQHGISITLPLGMDFPLASVRQVVTVSCFVILLTYQYFTIVYKQYVNTNFYILYILKSCNMKNHQLFTDINYLRGQLQKFNLYFCILFLNKNVYLLFNCKYFLKNHQQRKTRLI